MSLTTDDAPPGLVRPAFAPGTIVADRYRIEARLGAGGGGTVFRCVDQRLNAIVALKVVASDGDLERLRREVAMARQITDRNVCRVHDLGETAEFRFVTMELVEGTNLRSKIRPDLPAAEARTLIEQLIAGVAAIHAAGVVHRDLKPENVVVAADGRAVIVDFGLAKTPSSAASTRSMRAGADPSPSVTRAGVAVGTPRYMSPEQAAGEAVDARTDVWSLGLVAHELLTGAMAELDADGLMVAPVVDQRWPGFAAILRGCFALDPAGRFPDVGALRAALASNAPAIRVRRPRSRWPFIVAAVAVSAVIGFVVVRAVRGGVGETASPRTLDTPTQMKQLTTSSGVQWPEQAPTSVALDPTATKIAFTTAGGRLYVRGIAGGAIAEWATTVGIRDKPQPLASPRVIGWFADGSLAIAGTTASMHHVIRLRADGSSQPIYESTWRSHAAVSPRGDRIAVARRGSITDEAGAKLADVAAPDRVVALAWSTDGKLAWMRVTPNREAVLEIVGAGEVWRGRSELLIAPLLAYAGEHIAFSFRDRGRTTIARIDPATRKVSVFEELADHVGSGNVVNGTLVTVRGPAREAVQIRDRFAGRNALAHADHARGTHVAGWTTRGAAVYRVDDRVVAGQMAGGNIKSWHVDPWPGTQATDVPAAVIGDDVLVRRDDGDAWIVERVTGDGTRTRVGRFERATGLHCVGTGCVLQQRRGDEGTWTELDPATGALGTQIHRRPLAADLPSFSLSRDNATIAIATGGEAIVMLDRATGHAGATPPAPAITTSWATVAFDDAGDLWATAVDLDAHPLGLVRFRGGTSFGRPSALVTKSFDALRWFSEPSARGTESELRIAVATQELHLEIWRADGF